MKSLRPYLTWPASTKQDRISLWHEQATRYASELRELKQHMVSQLENLDKEKETLRVSLDSMGMRVDRVERELDYLETQNGAQPCVDVDDKLIEQQVTQVQEKQKTKYFKLTGERLRCSEFKCCLLGMSHLHRAQLLRYI